MKEDLTLLLERPPVSEENNTAPQNVEATEQTDSGKWIRRANAIAKEFYAIRQGKPLKRRYEEVKIGDLKILNEINGESA